MSNRTVGSGSKTTTGDNSQGGGGITLPLIVNGIVYASNASTAASTSAGTTGQVLTSNGGFSPPTFQTITSIPLTASANTIFSGPVSGGPAAPTFRSMVYTDLPTNVQTLLALLL